MKVRCPACSAEMDLDVLMAHEEGRMVLAEIVSKGVPMGALMLRYVGLFRPGKRAMQMSRTLCLLSDLWTDMQRGAISRKGREWPLTDEMWRQALEQMLQARDKGSLSLPLSTHGYLHEVLMGLSCKAESQAEKQIDAQRVARAHKAGLEAASTSIDAAVEAVRPSEEVRRRLTQARTHLLLGRQAAPTPPQTEGDPHD